MKAAPLISLGLSVVLGAGAILFGRGFMATGSGDASAEVAAPAIAMTSILVSNRVIEPGAVIDPTSLKSIEWPVAAVPAGALREVSELGDKAYARGLMVPGDLVLSAKIDTTGSVLTLAAAISPGMRAVSIVVGNDTGVAGFVLPGDRVDVNEFIEKGEASGTPEGARVSANMIARPVLKHVKVLAVDQAFDPNLEGALPSNTVTLEVTPEDALLLGAASQRAALGLALIGRDEEALVVQQAVLPVRATPRVQTRSVPHAPSTTTVRVINGTNDVQVTTPVAGASGQSEGQR